MPVERFELRVASPTPPTYIRLPCITTPTRRVRKLTRHLLHLQTTKPMCAVRGASHRLHV